MAQRVFGCREQALVRLGAGLQPDIGGERVQRLTGLGADPTIHRADIVTQGAQRSLELAHDGRGVVHGRRSRFLRRRRRWRGDPGLGLRYRRRGRRQGGRDGRRHDRRRGRGSELGHLDPPTRVAGAQRREAPIVGDRLRVVTQRLVRLRPPLQRPGVLGRERQHLVEIGDRRRHLAGALQGDAPIAQHPRAIDRRRLLRLDLAAGPDHRRHGVERTLDRGGADDALVPDDGQPLAALRRRRLGNHLRCRHQRRRRRPGRGRWWRGRSGRRLRLHQLGGRSWRRGRRLHGSGRRLRGRPAECRDLDPPARVARPQRREPAIVRRRLCPLAQCLVGLGAALQGRGIIGGRLQHLVEVGDRRRQVAAARQGDAAIAQHLGLAGSGGLRLQGSVARLHHRRQRARGRPLCRAAQGAVLVLRPRQPTWSPRAPPSQVRQLASMLSIPTAVTSRAGVRVKFGAARPTATATSASRRRCQIAAPDNQSPCSISQITNLYDSSCPSLEHKQ